jgi:hypothetical protein
MLSRKSIAVTLVGAALALIVAACGSPLPTATPTPTGTPAPTPTTATTPTATPAPAPTTPPPDDVGVPGDDGDGRGGAPVIQRDPDYLDELRGASFSTFVWKTDFSLHTVPYAEISSGGPGRDGIPPIDNPRLDSIEEADRWIGPQEPVIALEDNGEAKAYPIQVLIWHEIANDEIGGVPVTVTFCPLCNSAIVFDSRLDGVVYDFGVSGNLRNSDLIMWDRQKQSWWQQLTGKGIVGKMAGRQLKFIPAPIVSWEAYKEAYPGTLVLNRDTGVSRNYGTNPYSGYDRVDNTPFLFDGESDGRLLPKERVVAIEVNGVDAAFPFPVIARERAVNYTVGGVDVAVFFEPGTVSALDGRFIYSSKDIGSTGVFVPSVDGQRLTFRLNGTPEDGTVVDNETGSTWSILGTAIKGPLAGSQLERIVHQDHFWFAWAAFKPDTLIYTGAG